MSTAEFDTAGGNRAHVTAHTPSRVHAVLDDLRLASSTLTRIGGSFLTYQVDVGAIEWHLPLAADVISPTTSAPCAAHVYNLTLGKNSLGARATAAIGVGALVTSCIAAYEGAELAAELAGENVERSIAVGRLALALGYGLSRMKHGASASDAATDALDAFPGAAEGGAAFVGLFGSGLGYTAMVKLLGALGNNQASQGGPVAVTQRQQPGPRQAAPARSIGNAAHRINDLHRNGSTAAHIQAQRVRGTDGVHRWVVLVPGTQDFTANRANPADGTGILQSIAGHPSAMTAAVTNALTSAQKAEGSYGKGEPVMIVGHSQGGMVASNMARDPDVMKNFNITHVATFGAPVTHLAPGVSELDVVNTRDLVPAASGIEDGHEDDKRVRVEIDDPTSMTNSDGKREFAGAHDAHNYGIDYSEAVAAAPEDSPLRRFETETRSYFDGDARTYTFDAHRGPRPEQK